MKGFHFVIIAILGLSCFPAWIAYTAYEGIRGEQYSGKHFAFWLDKWEHFSLNHSANIKLVSKNFFALEDRSGNVKVFGKRSEEGFSAVYRASPGEVLNPRGDDIYVEVASDNDVVAYVSPIGEAFFVGFIVIMGGILLSVLCAALAWSFTHIRKD